MVQDNRGYIIFPLYLADMEGSGYEVYLIKREILWKTVMKPLRWKRNRENHCNEFPINFLYLSNKPHIPLYLFMKMTGFIWKFMFDIQDYRISFVVFYINKI